MMHGDKKLPFTPKADVALARVLCIMAQLNESRLSGPPA